MLPRLFLVALLAGLVGGVLLTSLQSVRVLPLILQAETYENGAAAVPAHDHDATPTAGHDHAMTAAEPAAHDHGAAGAWEPEDGIERLGFTFVANTLAAIGFALVLVAGFALTGGEAGWRRGLFWGFAGYVTVLLAPSLGLPLEPPGMAAAPLGDRQLWWLATVAATAAGLALIFLVNRPLAAVAGVVLIALPHVLGAPMAPAAENATPEALARAFAYAALLTGFVFWAVLGTMTGVLFARVLPTDDRTAA